MIPVTRFRVNTPDVVYETIEGETVIVNMSTAMYFSVSGVGGAIWALVAAGKTELEINITVAGRYSGGLDAIQTGVGHFFAQLQREGLITPDENALESSAAASPASAPPQANKPAFTPPILEIYNDMEDLLLLDPIHNNGR